MNKLYITVEVRDKDYKIVKTVGNKRASTLNFWIDDNDRVPAFVKNCAEVFCSWMPDRIITIEVNYLDEISGTMPTIHSIEVNQGVIGEIRSY